MADDTSRLADLLSTPDHPLISSSDRDAVVEGRTRALRPHRLIVTSGGPRLATRLHHLPLKSVSINRLYYGTDVYTGDIVFNARDSRTLMRENITSGPIPFRKACIKSVVDRIKVGDHAIRIVGDQATLEQAIAGGVKCRSKRSQFCTQVARYSE